MPAGIAPLPLPFLFAEGLDPVHCTHRVHPQLLVYVGFIARAFFVDTRHRMVITSMSRPGGGATRHDPQYKGWCLAFDMRTHDPRTGERYGHETPNRLYTFVYSIKSVINIGALVEPDWMTPEQIAERGGLENIAPHVHWQIGSNNRLWLPAPDLPALPV